MAPRNPSSIQVTEDDFSDLQQRPPVVTEDDFSDLNFEEEPQPAPIQLQPPARPRPAPMQQGLVQLNPARSLPELVSRGRTELEGINQGLNAAGSYGWQRIREIALDQAANPLNKMNPAVLPSLRQVYDQRGQRPSDLQAAGQIGADIIKNLRQTYVEPLYHGPATGEQDYLSRMRDQFLTTPVGFLGDTTPFIFKGLGAAGEALDATAQGFNKEAQALRLAADEAKAAKQAAVSAGLSEKEVFASLRKAGHKSESGLAPLRAQAQRLENVANFAQRVAHPVAAAEGVYMGGAGGREAIRILTTKIRLFKQMVEMIKEQLEPLEKQMSPAVRKNLVLAGERTDNAAIATVYGDPIGREYMKRSNAIADFFAAKLVEAGLVTEFDILAAKYGPEFLKIKQLELDADAARRGIYVPPKQGPRRYVDEYGTYLEWDDTVPDVPSLPHITSADLPLFEQELRAFAKSNQAAGKMNVYFRIISEAQVESQIKKMTNMRNTLGGGISKTDQGVLLPRGEDVRYYPKGYIPDPEGNIFHAGTVRWDGASFDATNLRLAGAASAAKFLYLNEAMRELAHSPSIVKLSGTLRNFDSAVLLRRAAEATGSSRKVIEKYIESLPPEMRQIRLPKAAIDRLVNLVADENPGKFTRVLRGVNTWWKIHILGTNLTFPPVQWLQGGMVYAVAAFRGVQDFHRSMTALVLSMMPDVDDIVRDFMLETKQVYDVDPTMANWLAQKFTFLKTKPGTLTGGVVQGAKAAFHFVHDTFPEAVLNASTHADNFWRRAGIIYFLMREAESMPGHLRQSLKQAFDLQVQLDKLVEASAHPQLVGRAADNLYKFFGHYEEQFGEFQRIVNDYWMWYRWTKHAFGLALAMPQQVPYKTALIGRIARSAPQVLQDNKAIPEYMKAAGAVPFYDKNGNVAVDVDGVPMVYLRKGLTPFSQTPENVAVLSRVAGSVFGWEGSNTLTPEERAIVEKTHKLPEQLVAAEAGMEGFAFSPVINLGVEAMGISARTGRPMLRPQDMGVRNPSGSSPGLAKLVLRNLLTPLDRPLSALWEYPYAPSDFSMPGMEHAPRLGNLGAYRHGLPPAEELILLGKFKPSQTTAKPAQMKKMMKGTVESVGHKGKFKDKKYPPMKQIRMDVNAVLRGHPEEAGERVRATMGKLKL